MVLIKNLLLIVALTVVSTVAARSIGGTPLVGGMFFGGVEDDAVVDVAQLPNGDVVICGNLSAPVVVPDVPGVDRNPLGGMDGFLAVVSSDLRTIKAFTYVGGRGMDSVVACAVGPDGRVVVCGVTESQDLKTVQPCINVTYSANRDGFLQFFSSDLSRLTYGTFINGHGDDTPLDLIVDEEGHTYICGRTTSQQGMPLTNAIENKHKGGQDGFLLKISISGGQVVYGTYVGGASDDVFTSMALREDGAVLLTGWTMSTDFQMAPRRTNPWGFPTGDKPYDDSFNGGRRDAILTLVSGAGSNLIFSSYFGGKDDDEGRAVGFDSQNNPVIIGITKSSDLPVAAGRQQSIAGGVDGFIATLTSDGKSLSSASYFGGNGDDIVQTAVWSSGNQFYVMGSTTSRDWSPNGAGTTAVVNGLKDLFLIRVSASQVSYATTIGGLAQEDNVRMILDKRGDVYAACASSSPRMLVGIDTIQNNGPTATWDGLVVKWAFGTVALSTPTSSSKICQNQSVTVSWYTADINNQEVFRLDYSTDRRTWTRIVDSLTTRSYHWNPSGLDPSKSYWVRLVSGRGHTAVHDMPLRIHAATEIISHPINTELCSGESLTLSVEARGDDLLYQWKKNGIDIAGQTAQTYTIGAASPSIAGSYTVVVKGQCGQVASSPAIVDVVASPIITEHPKNVELEVGNRLELITKANIVTAEYQWYRNDEAIVGETSPRLVISSVKMSDAGLYNCTAKAACGVATSTKASIVVRDSETIIASIVTGALSVMPQPASDFISVKFLGDGVSEWRLRDVMGRTAHQNVTEPHHGESLHMFDVSTIPVGTYVLEIRSGQYRYVDVVVVSR